MNFALRIAVYNTCCMYRQTRIVRANEFDIFADTLIRSMTNAKHTYQWLTFVRFDSLLLLCSAVALASPLASVPCPLSLSLLSVRHSASPFDL